MREFNPGASLLWQQGYTIDRYGNRTIDQSNTSGGINSLQFNVDPNTNRLTVPSSQSGVMSYDNAGNLTNDTYTGQGQRIYDAENRMTQAQGGGNGSLQYYTYDGDGHRVKRIGGGTGTWQVYGIGGAVRVQHEHNGGSQNSRHEGGGSKRG